MVEIIDGGITTPQGFKATGVHSGVKYRSLDMGLLYSEVPTTAFMAFTSNNVKAAPVQLMMNDASEKLSAITLRVIVLPEPDAPVIIPWRFAI